jgi:hypothetical protein
LLIADQGIGEELFFLRFASQLKARGARVSFQPGAKVHALLRHRTIGLDEVFSPGAPLPAADYRIFLSALPLALSQFEAAALPARVAGPAVPDTARRDRNAIAVSRRVFWPTLPAALSLEPNSARLKFWRERLAEMGAPPYIALTWRAGTVSSEEETQRGASHPEKVAPADALCRALSALPGTIISLQWKPQADEIDSLSAEAGRTIHDCARANDDLEDALALLAAVDEYVCVSNTNTHLRAAAGRTARVLVPWPAHWRWMARGAESPWFPGSHVYRQRPDSDWSAALEQLAADLRARGGA